MEQDVEEMIITLADGDVGDSDEDTEYNCRSFVDVNNQDMEGKKRVI